MTDSPIFYAENSDPAMHRAIQSARHNFKYFWREVVWDNRRIVPALEICAAKIAFSENINGEEVSEHMWATDLFFDGTTLYSTLVNDPERLTQLHSGDNIAVPLGQLSDWLFVCDGVAHGGFTIQALRAQMSEAERQEHDEAWGINFGDSEQIWLVQGQETQPENLIEHPMCRNGIQMLAEHLAQEDPSEIDAIGEDGQTMLQRESIAGNGLAVKLLLERGADATLKDEAGNSAADYARIMQWEHILPLFGLPAARAN